MQAERKVNCAGVNVQLARVQVGKLLPKNFAPNSWNKTVSCEKNELSETGADSKTSIDWSQDLVSGWTAGDTD